MANAKLITRAGYDKLFCELNHLKNVERPAVSAAVGAARELGDLRENAEYETSKERQSQVEARISFLEQMLIDSIVFDPKTVIEKDIVHFGAKVKVEDIDSGETREIRLVGEYESDVRQSMISIVSPLGSGLLNKSVGDVIEFVAPSGKKEYEIIEILYDF